MPLTHVTPILPYTNPASYSQQRSQCGASLSAPAHRCRSCPLHCFTHRRVTGQSIHSMAAAARAAHSCRACSAVPVDTQVSRSANRDRIVEAKTQSHRGRIWPSLAQQTECTLLVIMQAGSNSSVSALAESSTKRLSIRFTRRWR